MVDMEIILSAENNKVILEIYEIEPVEHTSKSINYDVVYTLLYHFTNSEH